MNRQHDSKRGWPLLNYWTFALIGPLFGCVVLNAIVRPSLGKRLGGEQIRRGAAIRGADRWWVFDEQTRHDHPLLTNFLNLSDGAVAMGCFGLIPLLILVIWVVSRLKTRGAERI